jgi:hypothetical protein
MRDKLKDEIQSTRMRLNDIIELNLYICGIEDER